jgi:hypothetical protein
MVNHNSSLVLNQRQAAISLYFLLADVALRLWLTQLYFTSEKIVIARVLKTMSSDLAAIMDNFHHLVVKHCYQCGSL